MLLSDKYPFLTDYFTKALTAQNRAFPQSILFYGNDFKSQYILANEIARLLNCLKDKSDDCDCLNCRWIREHAHPSVMTISRIDNKPEDDDSKTVISIKQSQMIKGMLVNASDSHRVFIFCDRDEEGEISGLNPKNFQAETANSLLKIIEEPQPGVTFIFLVRYIEDVLSTIISRSQCFFVPSKETINYDISCLNGVFDNYFLQKRKDVFALSENLQKLEKEVPIETILEAMQNYILLLIKNNPEYKFLLGHISLIETAKKQAQLGMRSINIFDDLCLKLIH